VTGIICWQCFCYVLIDALDHVLELVISEYHGSLARCRMIDEKLIQNPQSVFPQVGCRMEGTFFSLSS
jgi:hypothetical protein